MLLIGGSHHHSFRVHSALRVLAELRSRGVNASLTVAGRLAWREDAAVCRAEMTSWVNDLGVGDNVFEQGRYTQREAPEVFSRAQILVHTKYMDPCPRLVVEAMACGLPVVYSATGGVAELVGDSAGIAVSPSDDWMHIVEMDASCGAEAVIKVLSQYESYSMAARERAVNSLDSRQWIKEHEDLFRSILSDR